MQTNIETKDQTNNSIIYIQLALVTVIWGSSFVAAKLAMADFQPMSTAFFRFLGSAIFLWLMVARFEPDRPKLDQHDVFIFFILGLVGIFGYNALYFYGVYMTSVTKSSLIIATNPILIVILSAIFLKERVGLPQYLGITLGITGAAIIISNGDIGGLIAQGFSSVDLILLGAVICWATYSVVGKLSLKNFSPLVSTTYATTVGTIFLAPFAIYELSLDQLASASLNSWLAILYMSLFVSGISFVIWYDGIKKIGAAKASSFINLMPISAVVLAAIIFQERIGLIQFIGACLVLFGVYLSNKRQHKSLKKKEV